MEYKEEEVLLLLKFKEKIEQKFFMKPNLFFKIVNLETKKPFVQIGPHVFNGVYEDSLGTNLFFEEQDTPRESSIYEPQTPIHLKYVGKTIKVLTLRWQKIPDEIIEVDNKELSELEFRETYDTVLNKIANGTLDINEIIKREDTKQSLKTQRSLKQLECEVLQMDESEVEACKEQATTFEVDFPVQDEKPKEHKSMYAMLKDLVKKPERSPEYYEKGSNLDSFTSSRDFSILKELYLKTLDYQRISLIIDEKNIGNYVDIKASIQDGIITTKEPSKLNDRDKQVLLSLNNFDNLSIPTKLILLIEHLKEEKVEIGNMTPEELQVKDEFGRTAKDRYRLLKSLAKDLEYYLFTRIREKNLNGKESEE